MQRTIGAVFVLLLALLGSRAELATADAHQPPDGREVMQELLSHFHDLETHLEGRDSEAVGKAAAATRHTLSVTRKVLYASVDSGSLSVFSRYFDRADAVAREIKVLAGAGQTKGASQALADLRNACVACHVHYRSGSDSNSYPARLNTIAGRVTLKNVSGEALADRSWVLVFLEGASIPEGYKSLRLSPEMGQEGRQFMPRVLPVVRGSSVTFPNNDTVFHNVFSLSKPASFDLGIYPQGETRSVTFDRTGVVRIHCNIHPDMAASVVVLENPFYALTDVNGAFALTGVPDGQYSLRAWNDMGGEAAQQVEVVGGELKQVNFEVRETRKPAPHKNKFGKRYPEKY